MKPTIEALGIQAHRVAAQFLASSVKSVHGIDTYPVSLGRILEAEGVSVRFKPSLADGSLTRDEHRYLISVNDSLGPRRRRFTIAHELGHVYVDRASSGGTLPRATAAGVSNRLCIVESFDEELFCDAFAGYLLIPHNIEAEFQTWSEFSITRILKYPSILKVSLKALLWHILADLPGVGGALYFRKMGKPSDPSRVKLRVEWGIFPNDPNVFIPRYDAVLADSALFTVLSSPSERIFQTVPIQLGNFKAERAMLAMALANNSALAVVLPKQFVEEVLTHTNSMLSPSSKRTAIKQLCLFDGPQ